MKNFYFIAFFLVFTAGFAQEEVPPLVTVTGEGIVRIAPDKVIIRARVEHTGKSASEVKSLNDQVVSQVLEYVKRNGIPAENFQTEYVTLNKEFNYNTKETHYSANQAIRIQLEDLSRYEKFMSGLLNSGLNRIDGIEFRTSEREELEAEARREAVLQARRKAKDFAGALGQEIGAARMISELQNGNFPSPMYRAMEMKSADAVEQTLAPGEMKISVKVSVGFVLK